jgi:phage-related protein (TIGR01555 family)
MQMIELSRSVAKALVIDAEDESFTRVATSFAGLPDVLDRFADRLAAASGYPATVLFGSAPAGLNATGDSDIRLYYDRVQSYRRDEIKPGVERIVKAIMSEVGSEPEHWDIEFGSLYQPTDVESADLRQKVAQTDKLYVDMGSITPEEVTLSRFGETGWSMETKVDLELREKIDEANAVKLLEEAKNANTVDNTSDSDNQGSGASIEADNKAATNTAPEA